METFEVLVAGMALACPADYSNVLRFLFSIDFAFSDGALTAAPSDKKGDNTALARAVAVGVSSLYMAWLSMTWSIQSLKNRLCEPEVGSIAFRERGPFHVLI